MSRVSAVRNDEAQAAEPARERLREVSADEACGRVSMLVAMNDLPIHASEYREALLALPKLPPVG